MNNKEPREPSAISPVVAHYLEVVESLASAEGLARFIQERQDSTIPVEETEAGKVTALMGEGYGDAAVVEMEAGVHTISDLELHRGETELHFPISGQAIFVNGEEEIQIGRGDSIVVGEDMPHFFVPSDQEDYSVLVVSVPGFDPENLVSLAGADTVDPEHAGITEKYDEAVASLNS